MEATGKASKSPRFRDRELPDRVALPGWLAGFRVGRKCEGEDILSSVSPYACILYAISTVYGIDLERWCQKDLAGKTQGRLNFELFLKIN